MSDFERSGVVSGIFTCIERLKTEDTSHWIVLTRQTCQAMQPSMLKPCWQTYWRSASWQCGETISLAGLSSGAEGREERDESWSPFSNLNPVKGVERREETVNITESDSFVSRSESNCPTWILVSIIKIIPGYSRLFVWNISQLKTGELKCYDKNILKYCKIFSIHLNLSFYILKASNKHLRYTENTADHKYYGSYRSHLWLYSAPMIVWLT